MKNVLELGIGVHPLFPDSLHHDRICHSPDVHVAWDLNVLPWPWGDGQWDTVWAIDVMEHLKLDIQTWLDETWRILVPGGELHMRLPAWDNPLSYRDPTHERVFHEETFYYWDPRSNVYDEFGSYYFKESDKWWNVREVAREVSDLRYTLVKLGSTGDRIA